MSLPPLATVGMWAWEKAYGKAIADKLVGKAQEQWARFQWNEAAEKYRGRIIELYGTLRVLGKPDPVPLEGVTDVYIHDKPTAFRRFDISQLRADPQQLQDGKRISGLRLVTQPKAQRLFILGKPGAGKTTFLKHVALQAAQGKLDKIPVFVTLKEWSDSGLELMPFVARQFEICAFPNAGLFIEHILNKGQAIVLFDGLDEVNLEGDLRRKTTAAMEALASNMTRRKSSLPAASPPPNTHLKNLPTSSWPISTTSRWKAMSASGSRTTRPNATSFCKNLPSPNTAACANWGGCRCCFRSCA